MDNHRRRPPHFYPIYILLVVSFCSCKQRQVDKAYYYWRSGDATFAERKFLKQQNIHKLYVRILDVDWNEVQGAIPVNSGSMESINYDLKNYDSFPVQIVPVVFITNKTFESIDSNDLGQLAKRVVRRCLPSWDEVDVRYEKNHYFVNRGGPVRPKEIQIDCDWTVKTASYYFSFLKQLKQLLPADSVKVSATVRLHQYKYPGKTGVPPVDRGMLMVYNISDPKQYTRNNSIFEESKAKPYFNKAKQYPLPLDMALPAWSWCIVYRSKQFYQIENGLAEEDLKMQSFLQPAGDHFYRVTADTVYRDLFLRPGDEIKAEGIDEKMLQQAAALAKKAVNTDHFTVSLFELSEKELNQYKDEILTDIYTRFH
jgi:hypothetical protein